MDAALIALIGLGGICALSKQSQKENFSNINDNEETVSSDVNEYENTNAIHDKDEYYTNSKPLLDLQNLEENQINLTSLSGNKMSPNEFTHNNMVPYFGGKIRGRGANLNQAEGLLDNKMGIGSQVFKKKEQAPLFNPEDNIQWTHGQPNFSNFLQSRQNPSLAMNNVKPWEEERVAPGLGNDKSSLGFNSGLMSRESWLPKTVDQLRVDTNPKNTYELKGHEGPPMSTVLKPGIEGEVTKNRPETAYANSPERYIVTMGEGGSRPRTEQPVELLKCQTRPETTAEYHGHAGSVNYQASKAEENYTHCKKDHVYSDVMGGASISDHQPMTDNDYSLSSYNARPNNRVTTKSAEQFGAIGGNASVVGSVISPILDAIRPSRKEETINGIRQSGNIQQAGQQKEIMFNPSDRVKTTIRDTLDQPFNLNVQAAKRDGYLNSKQLDKTTQREGTKYFQWSGGDWSKHSIRLDDAERNQRNNYNKLTPAVQVHGNMSMFNNNINSIDNSVNRELDNNRSHAPSRLPKINHSVETYGELRGGQHYDHVRNNDRIHPDLLQAFKKNPYTHSLHSTR